MQEQISEIECNFGRVHIGKASRGKEGKTSSWDGWHKQRVGTILLGASINPLIPFLADKCQLISQNLPLPK